jgi:outer membrane protein assembly factor BamB
LGSTVSDIVVMALDGATGAKKWLRSYNGPAGGDDVSYGIGRSRQGDVTVIAGLSQGIGADDDAVTIAYDTATGAPLWVERYDGPAHGSDEGVAVAVAPDDETVYVTGDSLGPSQSADYLTLAYNLA